MILQLADYCEDPLALDHYLRQHWRYLPDPEWAEYVEGPRYQMDKAVEYGYYEGDCDDASTLAACLCLAMDWPVRIVAYRLPGNSEFSHVNVRCTGADGSVFDIDPTVLPKQLPIVSAEETMEIHV